MEDVVIENRIPSHSVRLFVVSSLAILIGCSAQQPPESVVVWQNTDGTAADRAALEVAADECREATRKSGGAGDGRFSHIEWAANMLDCMKEKGFVRVEEPAAAPAEGSD